MIAANPIHSVAATQQHEDYVLDHKPWFILQSQHERVNYQFDAITEFLGNEEHQEQGIGFTFYSQQRLTVGSNIQIGFPLPDAIRSYTANIVSQRDHQMGYEYGIWIAVTNDFDLLSILNSCDYLDIRQNS